ncbi:uncharacterized protein LOC18435365 [Amborella trichopoda]|uniref:RING-type domain-containing protein n=1 Tax=Amborella trichopoda TaxID=13333 RepID=W1PGP6_AMBTC|nr:uncharacterized protein LOC18435365 [Amborella trichopoda]ERN07148.1 hypothetical protein AMTR_s00019p00134390 [Amborella trichopoda]|eukprot:XP_006845473.1 uncharacterized protein LOC18435365 [Amborella trichopoda]
MGNALVRRSRVDERYTRPQGKLYEHANVDYKKLRRLILHSKLAPCFPGSEDALPDLEECPICCFYYPSLNRSRCCAKSICTECFLQMKPSNSVRPAQCPFCKTSSYAVEFRGARTQEEKGLEQAEEQKFIEAKIRMQCRERQAAENKVLTEQELIRSQTGRPSPSPCVEEPSGSSGSSSIGSGDTQDVQDLDASSRGETVEVFRPLSMHRQDRNEEFDLDDLEGIMVMEAIWHSIQDPSLQRSVTRTPAHPESQSGPSPVTTNGETALETSVTGGLAFAIATLAEQNITRPEPSSSNRQIKNSHQLGSVVGASDHESDEADHETRSLDEAPDHDSNEVDHETGCLDRISSCSNSTQSGSLVDQTEPIGEIEGETTCSSSTHSLSDSPCTSPKPIEGLRERDGSCSLASQISGASTDSFEGQMMVAMALSIAESNNTCS